VTLYAFFPLRLAAGKINIIPKMMSNSLLELAPTDRLRSETFSEVFLAIAAGRGTARFRLYYVSIVAGVDAIRSQSFCLVINTLPPSSPSHKKVRNVWGFVLCFLFICEQEMPE